MASFNCKDFPTRNPFEPSIMKQTPMVRNILHLPEEIIRNILNRLPVKSLIRFLCVCKRWKNLIQNPSFIADHLQQSTHRNASLLFGILSNQFPLRLLDCRLQFRVVPKTPLIDTLGGDRVLGSCNGLLLVETHEYKSPLALWNPATKAVRRVPILRIKLIEIFPRTFWFSDHLGDCTTGFGFSSIVNDYKIVRTYAGIGDIVDKVYVFSLNRGSWKGIDVGNLEGVTLNSETVTANGAIFWYGVKLCKGEDDVKVIVSFDIAKEVFTLIPRPNFEYNVEEKLTVYENKLAILCDIWEEGETTGLIDLWVLDEGTCVPGETWKWTKRYTSSLFSCRLKSRTIWRNEIVCTHEYIVETENEENATVLYLINLSTNEAKMLVIPYYCPFPDMYNYAESLVSFGNY